MSTELQLVPFHGNTIEAVVGRDQQPWVVVKRICENLGISEERQARKLKEQPWATAALMAVVGADGKQREMFCCNLDTLRLGRDQRVIDTSLIGERPSREDRVEAMFETILQEVRAGHAQRAPERLFTAKQMCAYLQITPRRWRDLYLGGDLDAAELRLGEGEEELRWDPGAVLSLLKAKAGRAS